MAVAVTSKNFEADTLAGLETAVNTFLETIATKDVLDVQVRLQRAGRYGLQNAYFATVVYTITLP